MKTTVRKALRNNGLSIVLLGLFAACMIGQAVTGWAEENDERRERGDPPIGYIAYLESGSFVEATMENWESEFLQMFAYVLLTAFLYQKGSAESKDPDTADAPEHPRVVSADAPWPVRRGGWWLRIYQHSLSLSLLALFLFSLVLHATGGAAAYNEERVARGDAPVTALAYTTTTRFWFESFQNWQSEFFSIWAMIVLGIFLRQKASPESKPVESPHSHTGTSA